jgi:hypothetical protein
MHISNVVHIWSKKTKNTNVFLLFQKNPFADILLIKKIYYNFQVLKWMRLFLRNDRRSITGKNGPLKVLLSQLQFAISPEVMLVI